MPAAPGALPELEPIREPGRAAALLHPLRLEVLARARQPRSASEIAAELGLPRQRVNYHVRALAAAGLLRPAERRRRRGLFEQRYVASARAYLLAPQLLGEVAAGRREVEDRLSAAFLLAVAARSQDEVLRADAESRDLGTPLATLTLEAELRFASADQRAAFAGALRDAVARVVADHSAPARLPDGASAPGTPYRLALLCHPAPPPEEGRHG